MAGTRYKLTEFVAENSTALQEKYQQLSTEDRRKLVDRIVVLRKERGKVKRANPMAIRHDINMSFDAIGQEVCVSLDVLLMC